MNYCYSSFLNQQHAKYSCQLEQSKTLNVPWFILLKYSSREQDLCSLDALEEYRHRFVSKFGAIYLTPQDLRAAQSGDAIFDTAQVLDDVILYTIFELS